MRLLLLLTFGLLTLTNTSQNLVLDSSFDQLGEFYHTDGLLLQWHKGAFSKGEIIPQKEEGRSIAAFRFSVSSVKVDPNYIVAQLKEEMKAGYSYELSIQIKKDRFSPFNLRELQAYFGTSFNKQMAYTHGSFGEQLVKFKLDSISSMDYVTITTTYEAHGGEEFIYLGSIIQEFSLVESTRLGLLMADNSYAQFPHNCTYFIQKINIQEIGFSGKRVLASNLDNWYNYKSNQSNLVINGGAEAKLEKRYYQNNNTFGSTGTLIAPFAYSLTSFVPTIEQLDSNDYRSSYNTNSLCYMGDGQFILDALGTNVYHEYQEVKAIHEGKEYDTHYIYERSPNQQIKDYAFGEYLILPLSEVLTEDIIYQFSGMIKISESASFGVSHLGVHFLNEFPENIKDSLWQRQPEEVFEISHLVNNQAWFEYNVNYVSKGNERFIAIGHLSSLNGIIKNKTFERQVQDACGPNEYNCSDRYVHYKDSLFARYQLDNVALTVLGSQPRDFSSIYPSGQRVQLEIIFNEVKKNEEVNEKLKMVKTALINAQQVLRTEDAICIVDQRKKDPIILDPNPIINKKKILKKINKPKPVKKVKVPQLPPEAILFGEGKDNQNINHLVLVADEYLDISKSEMKLAQFVKNGGSLTVFFVGNDALYESFLNQFNSLGNVSVYPFSELTSEIMVRILLNTD